MYLWLFKWILFGTFCLTKQAERNRPFTLEFYNTTCGALAPLFKFYECTMHRLPSGAYTFGISMMLTDDIDDDFQVHMQMDVTQRYSRHPLRLIDLRVEACGSLRSASGNVLLNLLLKESQRTSNFPKQCPFKKNILYGFKNYSLSPYICPIYSPHSNFSVQVTYSHNKILAAKHVTMGGIVKKKRNLKV